jgi:hypothetical protein
VPWCEDCAKYLTPTSLNDDGTCPSCGRPVGEIEQRATEEAKDERTPWHFKLLVAALGVYLGWRLVQGIVWIF